MGQRRKRDGVRGGLIAALFVVALVAGACGQSSDASPQDEGGPAGTLAPVDGGSLAVGVQEDVNGWNPHISPPGHGHSLMASSMLESLAVLGADGSPQPWLAVSWTPNATYDQWDVEIRDGVTFSNGEALDAGAVAVNSLDAINGLVSGQVVKGLITDVAPVDDLTVRFTISQPWAAFPSSYLASPMTLQMAPSALIAEDHGDKNPIGTGPFVFDEWIPGDHVTVIKNETYWRDGLPHLDEIEFKPIADSVSRANALRSGDLDMLLTTNALDAADLEAEGYHVIRDWDTQIEMVELNTAETVGGEPNPLANVHARRAIAHATDQDAVAESVGEGLATPTSPFSPDSPWGMPEEENGYPELDLEAARSEVEAYKDDTGEASLKFRLLTTADTEALAIAQLLQQQWSEAGIEAQIETIEVSAISGKLLPGEFQAAIIAIYNAPDPDQDHYFWSAATIGGPGAININMAQYTTPEIEAALKAGRESADPADRKAAYDDLVRGLNDGAVNVWLYGTPYSLVADVRVHGLEGAAEVPLANFQFKSWYADVWVD